MQKTFAEQRTSKKNKVAYPFVGLRPSQEMLARVKKLVSAAKKQGIRLTISGVFVAAATRQLPELERRFGLQ